MKLAVFFTTGIALRDWQTIGNLDRELKPYTRLSSVFETIYLFTYGGAEDRVFEKSLPTHVKVVPKPRFVPSKLYSFIMPLVHRRVLSSVDIYKTNQMSGSWAAVFAKMLYKKKLVVRAGYELLFFLEKQNVGAFKRFVISLLERFAYRSADRICLASRSEIEFVKDRFGIDEKKFVYLPNYIDVDLFSPSGIPVVPKRILFVGRFVEQKNLLNLVKALAGTDFELVLIGQGALKQAIEEAAAKHRVQAVFKGSMSNEQLPVEIRQAEIFVLPSLYEGCPKTLLEAMSTGVACIGARSPGIEGVIEHGVNGYLAGTSVDALREGILELHANVELRKKMGENARQTIMKNYTLEKVLATEEDVYKQLFYAHR